MIPKQIQSQLTPEKIQEIDLRAMGNLILNRTITLSHAVNDELLEPISQWLDDPHFMDKYAITIESDAPSWAEYKKRQRQWTEQQKALAAERLRLYWQEIQRKRRFQKDIKNILGNAQSCKCTDAHDCNCTDAQMHKTDSHSANTQSILSILAPFSPKEKHRAETKREFNQTLNTHLSNLLPWRLLIADQLSGQDQTSLNDLIPIIKSNPKADKISKFQHLLQMDKDGDITLEQDTPSADIQIIPTTNNLIQDSEIIIKDQAGRSYEFDWQTLSDAQRNKVIADAIERRIICKTE